VLFAGEECECFLRTHEKDVELFCRDACARRLPATWCIVRPLNCRKPSKPLKNWSAKDGGEFALRTPLKRMSLDLDYKALIA